MRLVQPAFNLPLCRPEALHKKSERYHGLVPWSITLVATPMISSSSLDATALGRGGSRFWLKSSKREAPRGKPVAS